MLISLLLYGYIILLYGYIILSDDYIILSDDYIIVLYIIFLLCLCYYYHMFMMRTYIRQSSGNPQQKEVYVPLDEAGGHQEEYY